MSEELRPDETGVKSLEVSSQAESRAVHTGDILRFTNSQEKSRELQFDGFVRIGKTDEVGIKLSNPEAHGDEAYKPENTFIHPLSDIVSPADMGEVPTIITDEHGNPVHFEMKAPEKMSDDGEMMIASSPGWRVTRIENGMVQLTKEINSGDPEHIRFESKSIPKMDLIKANITGENR